jgi:E2/UBC family protein E
MRREFILPEDDIAFLDGLSLQWETIINQGMHWLLIYRYPVCAGYNMQETCVAIKIETGYPRTPLDMAYFFPSLMRQDGILINATSNQIIDGKTFQRWSRHRTAANPWREGVDDVSTHLCLVDFWFRQEFIKKPHGITT